MKKSILWDILEKELGAEKDDGVWHLPQGTRLTVFLSIADKLLPISKVTSITAKSDYAVLSSDDGRVFVDLDEIAAVRADEEAGKPQNTRVGFG